MAMIAKVGLNGLRYCLYQNQRLNVFTFKIDEYLYTANNMHQAKNR